MALGNPAPLGLLAFAMTTAMLMYVEMEWVETEFEALIAGYALFLGGVGQMLVAVFEIIKGSSFSFAVFGCYGAFWLGWGFIYIESNRMNSNFDDFVYRDGKTLWLIQWGVLSLSFFIITLRKNICLVVVFALLATTFFLLAAATGSENADVKKVAGYFGFATAIGAWYTGVAELINEEWGRHILPGLGALHAPERFEITKESVAARTSYDSKTNTMFLQIRGMQIKSHEDIRAIRDGVAEAVASANAPNEKVHAIIDYEDVLIASDISDDYWEMVAGVEKDFYLSAKRFHVTSFGTPSGKGGTATMVKVTETKRQVSTNSTRHLPVEPTKPQKRLRRETSAHESTETSSY